MRNRPAEKRTIKPDLKYNSIDMAKFIREFMCEGKLLLSSKICYTSLENVSKTLKIDTMDCLDTILKNIEPTVILVSKKIGGAVFQFPKPVEKAKRRKIALSNLKKFTLKSKGKSMIEKLTSKLLDCYNNQGDVVKEKEKLHKMAESNENKVFSNLG